MKFLVSATLWDEGEDSRRDPNPLWVAGDVLTCLGHWELTADRGILVVGERELPTVREIMATRPEVKPPVEAQRRMLNHLNTFKRRPHLDTCHDQVGSGEVVFKSVCGKRVVVPLRRFQVRSVRLGSL